MKLLKAYFQKADKGYQMEEQDSNTDLSLSEAQEELVVYYCWCWHKNKAFISRTLFFWNCKLILCAFPCSQKSFIWKLFRLTLISQINLYHLSVCITFGLSPCHFILSPLETLYPFMTSIIASRILPKTNLWLSPLFWTSVSTVQMSVGHLCTDGYSAVTSNLTCWKVISLPFPFQISLLTSIFLCHIPSSIIHIYLHFFFLLSQSYTFFSQY